MKVRANKVYRYNPCMWDILDAPYGRPQKGQLVRVKKLHGCPPPNTMGHCHIVDPDTDQFIGLVNTNSLEEINRASA